MMLGTDHLNWWAYPAFFGFILLFGGGLTALSYFTFRHFEKVDNETIRRMDEDHATRMKELNDKLNNPTERN